MLKHRAGEPRGEFEVPAIVPLLGVLSCGGLVMARLGRVATDSAENWQAPAIAGALIVLIAALYLSARPRAASGEPSLEDR